ncbi:type II CRISPR RNA-guided endonuclease Cas9 [Enterococcus faecalis]|uniref:type II CRISPR RNA-guided endonuclease Cas9 n=1 Tax=Enterococcus TaxID=1350 RepID=UPI00065FF10B|nr:MULTISPECIES: type II CRISPR RNA-guided endonuclease Cas9 [Enterococcus]EGO2825082.1 type II CRISPR RNA-guided endonuclease Cas9 [Enterococcus faecalis]EGO7550453.1 type II CRISPR RNA-guided endonuclease Cas9 [Enterococcus faecalis]EGO9394834.1 type II CRISPR RNA-guided endonuclease Cas9 [Enterococcus faecalis]EGS7939859.1 type II CRISPR RNA-guided endonuclease Cas9 [Enterococcus faecalis]EHB6469518.1 type II CRISPR RNA-guided endonuclease Cas9 [Enterococcus faecalis]
MKKDYVIGLDIGTNSVGWAVMTEDYQLVKKKMPIYGNTEKKKIKKNFWGVRLFEEGHTAEDRRLKRTARRRISRRRNRLRYLQAFFEEAMTALDENFFARLQESFLVPEDKKWHRHPIFAKLEDEVAYHETYPTIYHLRKKLADSSEQADLRLIYLALAHIVKYRGHFLIEGKLSTENISVKEQFQQFMIIYNQTFVNGEGRLVSSPLPESVLIEEELTEKASRTKKSEKVLQQFPQEKANGLFGQFLKLMVGNKADFKKVFGLEEEAKITYASESYEEDLEGILAKVGDEYSDVFLAAKNVYDAVELSTILADSDKKSHTKLSSSMIVRFTEHQEDLKNFKRFIRENCPDEYDNLFKNEQKDGYAGYIAHAGKVSQLKFYQYVKKIIQDIAGAEYFLEKIAQENFLRKQRTFDNGVIPHQIHLAELQAIIHRQAAYYPFLKENQEKIEQLVTFRIPYYVGPLSKGDESTFAWLKRQSEEPIRPWNLQETVDLDQSATAFIERMTNFDTYLPSEKVLPKHSLLYEKFMVFNELTKISYTDDRGIKANFSGKEKEKIFDYLFKTRRKVKKKDIIQFYRNEYNTEIVTLSGLEEDQFNASFSTYQDLLKCGLTRAELDHPDNAEKLEDIIKILTIFEDRQRIRTQLSTFKGQFSAEVLKKLERKHYTGWGRLSKKLINGIYDKESGKTILGYLIKDDGVSKHYNRNFMQLINDSQLSFKNAIQKAQSSEHEETLSETVNELAGSPAIKKGIYQSLKIVDELVAIMGYAPKRIVVEMARENQTTSTGKRRSIQRLKIVEKAMAEIGSNLLKEQPTTNEKLRDTRLFLYYMQNGKDMYTGDELSLHRLSHYDIDHIIPQSFMKDDSLDNLVLVGSTENRGKSDDVPSKEVVKDMKAYWEKLYAAGLISQRKFQRLTKGEQGGLTLEDKAHFIQRQLVETRQITKNVAGILNQRYNANSKEKKVQIITLKASLTSQVRSIFGLYKVREVNDYHHGQDAYLNCVVATTLLKVYPNLAPEFVYGEYPKFQTFKENKATAKAIIYTNLLRFFTEDEPRFMKDGEILWSNSYLKTIKKELNYHQMNIVKKVEVQKGGFSKESIKPKGPSNKLIPVKNGLDPQKYGGFDSPVVAYTVLFTHEKGKKPLIKQEILGITIMEKTRFEQNPILFLEEKGFLRPRVLMKLPKYTLYEFPEGRRRLLASAKEAQKGNQMVLPEHLLTLLYHAKQCLLPNQSESLAYVEQHQPEFQEILERVVDFAEVHTLAKSKVQQIVKLFEANQTADVKEIAASFIQLMQFNAMGAPSTFKFFQKDIERARYTSIKEIFDATIIYQSPTGLYETRRKVVD